MFGYTAYAHTRQDKLQLRAKKCIFFFFVGYLDGVKGYRLWCIELGEEKCIVSRDVVFNGKEMPMLKTIINQVSHNKKSVDGVQIEVEFETGGVTQQQGVMLE